MDRALPCSSSNSPEMSTLEATAPCARCSRCECADPGSPAAMAIQDPTIRADLSIEEVSVIDRGPAVSWGAILAGAFAAAALSFVLLAIGAAFGLSVASPWDFGRG